ncbi:LYR motif-containing protein 4 [Gouania willdenowi]|uniref:LYR motif-containing protein 4 n=1 Tax=Gouania willdenowi TaxID=441366 RepID=UPI0010566E7A|nr:LYR motif-containing protein 4 [Gouania willdenowi]
MAAVARSQVISLYRRMLRESSCFPSYNYRLYALRRVRDAFRANKNVEDLKAVERLIGGGTTHHFALIQRQVSIGKMYEAQKIVVE